MKRIALAAAAVTLLGTGCIVHDDDTYVPPPPPGQYGSVNLYWDFVRSAPAQTSGMLVYDDSDTGTYGSCDESAVDVVEVTSPLGTDSSECVAVNGVEGMGLDGIPAGVRSFRLRGWRGNFLVYDTTVSLEVFAGTTAANATSYFVDLEGVSANVDLSAYLAYGNPAAFYASCAAAFDPYLAWEIRDVFGQLVDAGEDFCNDPLPSYFGRLPLDLDDYHLRMQGLDGGSAVVLDSCWVDLAHFTTQIDGSGVAPTLFTLPVPTCTTPW